MPKIAALLGVLGLAPFIFFGAGAVGPDPGRSARMVIALVDYGALVLAFAGGVHWGLAMKPGSGRAALRFAAGTVPLTIGWMVLVLLQVVAAWIALAVLCIGTLATMAAEHRAAQAWLVPREYVRLRWGLSIVGFLVMALALVLRALGQTIAL